MIFGECPHCNEPFAEFLPDDTPCVGKVDCERCSKWFWEYFSRLHPQSFLPDDIEVDEETKSIVKLNKELIV